MDVISIVEVLLPLVFQSLADMSKEPLFIIRTEQRHRLIHEPLKAHEVVVTNFLALVNNLLKHTKSGILLNRIIADKQITHHISRLDNNTFQHLIFLSPQIIAQRLEVLMVMFKLPTSDSHHIHSNQSGINQIPFFFMLLAFLITVAKSFSISRQSSSACPYLFPNISA